VRDAISWPLFFHFVTLWRGGGRFYLLFHSLALLPVSARSIGSVFILFSLCNCGIGCFYYVFCCDILSNVVYMSYQWSATYSLSRWLPASLEWWWVWLGSYPFVPYPSCGGEWLLTTELFLGVLLLFLDRPDDDCHKLKHVAIMLHLNVSCIDGNIL